MITIQFAGWISGRIVSFNQIRISKNCFQTGIGYGSGYPKHFHQYFEDSDFCKKLHIAQLFIYYLQKLLFTLLCCYSESVWQYSSKEDHNTFRTTPREHW